jgi:prepilin peptidase CpaA
MPQPFFPNALVLAWAFYAVLVSITLIAAYTDLRYLWIPKWLTLPTLALGVLCNVVLGAWTEGPRGKFVMGGEGGLAGALDGLILALTGFATGFALFFVMFVLGTCKGGDVKLFAAIGAWVGPMIAIYLLAGTIVGVVVIATGHLAWDMASQGFHSTFKNYTLAAAPGKKARPRTTRRRLTAYSPAVALSASLVLLWIFGVELHVRPAKTTQAAQMAQR